MFWPQFGGLLTLACKHRPQLSSQVPSYKATSSMMLMLMLMLLSLLLLVLLLLLLILLLLPARVMLSLPRLTM